MDSLKYSCLTYWICLNNHFPLSHSCKPFSPVYIVLSALLTSLPLFFEHNMPPQLTATTILTRHERKPLPNAIETTAMQPCTHRHSYRLLQAPTMWATWKHPRQSLKLLSSSCNFIDRESSFGKNVGKNPGINQPFLGGWWDLLWNLSSHLSWWNYALPNMSPTTTESPKLSPISTWSGNLSRLVLYTWNKSIHEFKSGLLLTWPLK